MNDRIDRDRLSVITGALLLALALARLLDVPGRRALAITVFGSPLGINLSETTIMFLVIAGMSVTGVESLVRSHPLARQGRLGRSVVFWIVPGLLGVALAAWLSRIEDVGLWTLALIGCALLIPLALAAEYAAVDPEKRRGTRLQWSQLVLIHLVALILFAAIYDARLRSLISGPAVLLAATLLAARLLWAFTENPRRSLTYGAVAGLILAQMTWVFNYWRLSGLKGGLLLLLLFYVVVGLLQQALSGRFGRGVLLEYGAVALVALLAITLAVP